MQCVYLYVVLHVCACMCALSSCLCVLCIYNSRVYLCMCTYHVRYLTHPMSFHFQAQSCSPTFPQRPGCQLPQTKPHRTFWHWPFILNWPGYHRPLVTFKIVLISHRRNKKEVVRTALLGSEVAARGVDIIIQWTYCWKSQMVENAG